MKLEAAVEAVDKEMRLRRIDRYKRDAAPAHRPLYN
jgi:hypothetical protein